MTFDTPWITAGELALIAAQLCQIETVKRINQPRSPRPPQPKDFLEEAYRLALAARAHLQGK